MPHLIAGQAPTAKPRTRLVTLGTRSGPFPAGARAQSANAVIVGETVDLVDAGDGVARRMAEADLAIRNIDAIFLTHLHDDHTTGLVPLLSVEYQLDRAKPVAIFGPPSTEQLVKSAEQFLTINADIRVSEGTRARGIAGLFIGHDVRPGVVFRDANIAVRAVENNHFHFAPG